MANPIFETLHPEAFLVSHHRGLSHEQVTIDQSQTLVAGQVLGRYANAVDTAVTQAANAGNTGNGTMALATPAFGGEAREGKYSVTFTDTTHFVVSGPGQGDDNEATLLGEGVAGAAFVAGNAVKFTITAGGTAFVAGDGFSIQVSLVNAGMRYVAHNPAATDGSEHAVAILDYPVTTGSGVTAQASVTRRHAEVRQADLTFASGITTAQLDQLKRDLAVQMIVMR